MMVGGDQQLELEFIAGSSGLSLFHCHQQIYMHFGFMALFEDL